MDQRATEWPAAARDLLIMVTFVECFSIPALIMNAKMAKHRDGGFHLANLCLFIGSPFLSGSQQAAESQGVTNNMVVDHFVLGFAQAGFILALVYPEVYFTTPWCQYQGLGIMITSHFGAFLLFLNLYEQHKQVVTRKTSSARDLFIAMGIALAVYSILGGIPFIFSSTPLGLQGNLPYCMPVYFAGQSAISFFAATMTLVAGIFVAGYWYWGILHALVITTNAVSVVSTGSKAENGQTSSTRPTAPPLMSIKRNRSVIIRCLAIYLISCSMFVPYVFKIFWEFGSGEPVGKELEWTALIGVGLVRLFNSFMVLERDYRAQLRDFGRWMKLLTSRNTGQSSHHAQSGASHA